MSAASLLAKLRAVGVAINSEGGKLIIEAPPGVVTAELRAELVERKADLIATLEAADDHRDQDQPLIDARHVIAGVLAAAYRRYTAVQRVGTERAGNSGKDRLANSGETSVHGVVE
jgi:pyochelin synthetase